MRRAKHAIPLPDEQTEKTWGWIRAAAATLATFGALVWGAAAWDARHATRAEVREVVQEQASALDALDGQITLLRDRVAHTEAALDYISRAVYEVAQKTGATAVPPPPVAPRAP